MIEKSLHVIKGYWWHFQNKTIEAVLGDGKSDFQRVHEKYLRERKHGNALQVDKEYNKMDKTEAEQ